MEPSGIDFGCAVCGRQPSGKIDMARVIDRLEAYFAKNDMAGAGELLRYWRGEAAALGDLRGELSVCSEQMGYYRKMQQKEPAMEAVERGLALIDALELGNTVAAATITLNAATTKKAFGDVQGALPLYGRTQAVYEKELKEDDVRFAGFWNNYALALTELKQYKEAELAYHRALIILQEREDGAPDQAVTYVNLAELYAAWGGRSEEEMMACMDAAWELLSDETLPKTAYVAYVRQKCAPAFTDFGFASRGKELTKWAEEQYAGT